MKMTPNELPVGIPFPYFEPADEPNNLICLSLVFSHIGIFLAIKIQNVYTYTVELKSQQEFCCLVIIIFLHKYLITLLA